MKDVRNCEHRGLNLLCCILHRSELVAQVSSMKERWFNAVALASQCRSLVKEQLHQWRVHHSGSKLLWRLLRDVDLLLSPTGPAAGALLHHQVSVQRLHLTFSITAKV